MELVVFGTYYSSSLMCYGVALHVERCFVMVARDFFREKAKKGPKKGPEVTLIMFDLDYLAKRKMKNFLRLKAIDSIVKRFFYLDILPSMF